MPLIPRTLPTRLGADDKLVDVYLFSLTVFQVLNVLGGVAVAAEVLDEPVFSAVPLLVRQGLAAIAVLVGVFAAFWRHDGKSLWTWLWTALRFSRMPHRAISRPTPVTLNDTSDNSWYEVRPPLDWKEQHGSRRPRR